MAPASGASSHHPCQPSMPRPSMIGIEGGTYRLVIQVVMALYCTLASHHVLYIAHINHVLLGRLRSIKTSLPAHMG